MSRRALIGLLGGTFDPVHIGHLRTALELKQHLHMDEMRLVPCHIPPHRQSPVAAARHRAAMVDLAIAHCPDLVMDPVELNNPRPSYSLHTLEVLRDQLGPEPALCLTMGMDSLVSLSSWYGWERFLGLAHIVVAARPGWELPAEGPIADLVARHRAEPAELRDQPGGSIVMREMTLLPVSATAIRDEIGRGASPQFLVPDSVWVYILRNNLYR